MNMASTNGESQRRIQSVNRQHLNETIHRLAKPRNVAMTQSIHMMLTSVVFDYVPMNEVYLTMNFRQLSLLHHVNDDIDVRQSD